MNRCRKPEEPQKRFPCCRPYGWRNAGSSRWSRATYLRRSFHLAPRGTWLRLFHQVTGLFFLLFGTVGPGLYREYHAYEAGRMGPGRAILAGVLAVLFLYFSISNFVRAEPKRDRGQSWLIESRKQEAAKLLRAETYDF